MQIIETQLPEEEKSCAAKAARMGEHFIPQALLHAAVTQVTQVTQDITVPKVTKETEAMEEPELPEDLFAETVPMTYVFNKEYTTGIKAPTCMASALTDLAYALARMLGEEQNRRLSKLRGQVDHKLRSKIEQKKAAHGLKTDHNVQYYQDGDQEQSM